MATTNVFFLILGALLFFVLYLFQGKNDIESRVAIRRGLRTEDKQIKKIDDIKRYIVNYVKLSKPSDLSIIRKEELDDLILAAGEPYSLTASDITTIERFSAVVTGTIAVLYAYFIMEIAVLRLVVIFIAGSYCGTYLPTYYLKRIGKKRKTEVSYTIASVLDLLAVCSSTGLSSVEAIRVTAKGGKGLLAKELSLVVTSVDSGMALQDALYRLSKRLPLDEINEVYRTFVLDLELGSHPVGETLSGLADTVRQQQQDKIRQGAASAQAKVTGPIIVFLVPSLLIILIGPLLLDFMKSAK